MAQYLNVSEFLSLILISFNLQATIIDKKDGINIKSIGAFKLIFEAIKLPMGAEIRSPNKCMDQALLNILTLKCSWLFSFKLS